MIGYRVFTLDHSRFADINTLNEVMAIRNIKFVPILDPGVMVDSNYSIYKSGLKKDLFVKNRDGSLVRAPVWPGWCVFPDFTSKKARAWWGQHYQELLDFGAAGISHDMNEPETFAAWGSSTLPEDCLHDLDGAEGNHLEAHNLYGHLMNKSGYEALRNLRPDRRPWLLSRSGWAGSQRFAWNWTADIESSWDALKVSISMLINLGLSGIPFSGTDIGGFSGNPDAELFLRWFQLAAFHPFFRNHAAKGTQSREPWVYGEPYTSIIRKTMQARMALLPYLYTLAEEASRTGAPLTLPLFWLAPKQQFLHDINDAFLLGNDLLIAPVTEPGMTSRPVALPPGDWYDFKTGELYSGGGNINIATPLESIPVFARGGSIIPLEKEKELVLNIYPDKNGIAHGNIFYDAGDGYGETGSAEFKCVREGAALRLSVTKKGAYRFPWKQIRPEIIGENASKAIEVSC